MKNLVKILLLCIMLYNFIGYYALFIVLIENAKEDMKEELKNTPDKKELTLLRLPYSEGNVKDKDFELINEDEFSYKGKMYDIAKTEIDGKYINFYCISDSKEDELNLAVINHIQNNMNDNGGLNKKESAPKKVPLKKYTIQSLESPAPEKRNTSRTYITHQFKTISTIIDIASPPPRFI